MQFKHMQNTKHRWHLSAWSSLRIFPMCFLVLTLADSMSLSDSSIRMIYSFYFYSSKVVASATSIISSFFFIIRSTAFLLASCISKPAWTTCLTGASLTSKRPSPVSTLYFISLRFLSCISSSIKSKCFLFLFPLDLLEAWYFVGVLPILFAAFSYLY